MAGRGSRPSLYELGRGRLGRGSPGADPAPGEGEHAPPMFAPGNSIRLPVGGLVVGLIAMVLCVAAAWFIGHSAGQEVTRREADRRDLQPVEYDPLTVPPALVPPALVEVDPPRAPVPASPGVLVPGEPVEEAPTEVESTPVDPRQGNLWYFVLAETRPDGARDLVAFCRAQGLDAAVVPGHNARLARVIALPGLRSASSADPAYRDLDARIRDIGRRWKQSGRHSDLADRYLDRR